MTCIVGLVEDGKVYIGADSCSVDGWETRVLRVAKVFRLGEFIIGYTTSFRMGQILQHHLSIEPKQENEPDEAYLVRVFIEAARKCLKDFGFTTVDKNVESGGVFLVGYRQRLYRVSSDFQITEFEERLDAVGRGREYALGAMLALRDVTPVDRIQQALSITGHLCGVVMGPYQVLDG